MTGKYTMGGKPITVLEKDLKIGQRAPAFELVGNEFNILRISIFLNCFTTSGFQPVAESGMRILASKPA